MKTISIVWMYHNVMDLYGDQGNIKVLKKRCVDRGITLVVRTCGVGEVIDLREADMLFIGGGADREQGVMYDDLVSRKESIIEAISAGTMVLLICGGYQLFGQYYEDSDGKRLQGLGIFDYYTVSDGKTRAIGNVMVEGELDGKLHRFVGFENHGGMTHGVNKPLGKVLYGKGNNGMDGWEGYFDGQVLGTYMHGPLLPKNPEIADYFIGKALRRKYGDVTLEQLDDDLAIKARQVVMNRCLK